MVRELSKHQSASCLIVAFVIARFASLSCYSSAKTRIRLVKSYHYQPSFQVVTLHLTFSSTGCEPAETQALLTLHHTKDCKTHNKDNDSSPRANVVTFDIVDSDSDWQWYQGQVISWFWLTTLLLLPSDFWMAFFAFVQVTCFISFLLLIEFGNESVPYVPKRKGHRSLCGLSPSSTSCLMAHL